MTNIFSIFNVVLTGGIIIIFTYVLILAIRLAKKGIKALDIYIEKNENITD